MSDQKRILVIDDEPDLVELIKDNLELEDYNVLTASNGLDGLERLKNVKPHLIILDMNMPKMNGIEFYSHISDETHKETKYPVLVLTARTNLKELFEEMRVDGFMNKPFEIPDLIKEVKTIISKRWSNQGVLKTKKSKSTTKNVLIIEDDQDVFSQIVVKFAEKGHVVSGAKLGAEGIEKAKDIIPDVIVIKLSLPDISGDSVASSLKKLATTSDIPLILYSGNFESNDRTVIENIRANAGVGSIVESNDPGVIFSEFERILR